MVATLLETKHPLASTRTYFCIQYSQKQAEELKAEIKEREKRFRAFKKQELEKRAKVSNESYTQKKAVNSDENWGFDIQGLWHKIRGQNDKEDIKAA